MDDIVMNSPIGSTINEYQTAVAELNQLRLDMIILCYQTLDETVKENLFKYAQQLLENSEDFQTSMKEHLTEDK